MLGHMKLSDGTLVIVLHPGEQEIERELAPPADAFRVALMMLEARSGNVEPESRPRQSPVPVRHERRRGDSEPSENEFVLLYRPRRSWL
jgi:hypothetical protein